MKSHTLKNGRRLLGISAITTHTVLYNHSTRNKLELCKIYIYMYIPKHEYAINIPKFQESNEIISHVSG